MHKEQVPILQDFDLETWSDAQLASNVAVAKRKLRWKLLRTSLIVMT